MRRSLARGRVPGNVAGVERRGDGERQGLEIKKCKFARAFMATISLMVVCCEIFSIEENWGKRRGEGTLALRMRQGSLRIFDVRYSRPWRGRVTTLYRES